MENEIDVAALVKATGLPAAKVAAVLFPNNEHPRRALTRVMQGKSTLDARQVAQLQKLTGLSFDEIFSGNRWTGYSRGHTHIFSRGDWSARYNRETGETLLMHKGNPMHKEILTSPAITLNAFITYLENTIENL